VTPEDFVVFSIARDCPTRQLQRHEIPNLPSCANTSTGNCMCAWFWVHLSEGGTDQNYMNAFVCRVTNVRSDATAVDVANAQPPRQCWDPRNCFFGPRLPMYWHNERDNMPEPGETSNPFRTAGPSNNAPFYGTTYGWREGAQNDIFVNTNPYRGRRVQSVSPSSAMIVSGTANNTLTRGRTLRSPNGRFVLDLDSNCRVRIRDNGNTIYTSPNRNTGSDCRLVVGTDGRVETRTRNGRVWETPFTRPASSTVTWRNAGVPPYSVEVTNMGQMLVRDGYRQNRWESQYNDRRHWRGYDSTQPDRREWPADTGETFPAPPDSDPAPEPPSSGQVILTQNTNVARANGTWSNSQGRMSLQGDNNLVIFNSAGAARWSSRTSGTSQGRLFMQGDGNLVLRDASGVAVWSTGTHGTGADRVIYVGCALEVRAGTRLVWSSNSSC
jgi:hypothetical protein